MADEWISNAFRPATRRQHSYMVRLFVGLSVKLGMDFNNPSEELVLSFLGFLVKHYKTQKFVRSMFSTLKACLVRAHLDVSAFETTRVSLFVRSIGINKRTATLQRPPINVPLLKRIVSYWRQTHRMGHTLAATAIMMFVTSLHQSNLFPTSKLAFDPTRQLVWADIVWRHDSIKVQIMWGKSQQKTSTRFQRIPRADDRTVCLVSALSAIRKHRQRLTDPIFAFPDGSPLPISYVAKRWTEAISVLGLKHAGITMHSLRRGGGGARFLQDMGLQDGPIASHVGWRSAAMYDYIKTPGHRRVFCALKRLR